MKTKPEGTCMVCQEPAIQKCSGCLSVFYCSREHQKQHWRQHKHQCSPARVKQGQGVGRYLEATRDIKAGEVIIKESAMITGPAQVTPPVCLGCYKLLEEGKVVECDKCGWPFCSSSCTLKEEHVPECYYTQKRGEKIKITTFGTPHPNYHCITALRCLYQRDHNPSLWDKLRILQSHCEDRKGTEKWQTDLRMVAAVIWNFFKLEGVFSEEEIMWACGILQINGHEVPLSEPEHVALFPRVSMAQHHCTANCYKSFSSDGGILLSAGVRIPAGSPLSVCYTDPMWGTEARRHHLSDSWFFECECFRCADVTEFRTMYSSVKCRKKDCKGYLLPETFLVPIMHKTLKPDPKTQNLDDKVWVCNSCKDQVSDGVIQKLLQDIGRELQIMPKGDIDACERFISHCASYLPPRHYYLADVSLALAHLIGQDAGLASVSDDRLALKTQLCRTLAELMEVLAPAEWRGRGALLFELHGALADAGRRHGARDGPHVLLGYVTESRKILAEAASLLRNEPPELPEGKLLLQAKENLIQMDYMIQSLSAALPSPI